jgi:hypothetical protein
MRTIQACILVSYVLAVGPVLCAGGILTHACDTVCIACEAGCETGCESCSHHGNAVDPCRSTALIRPRTAELFDGDANPYDTLAGATLVAHHDFAVVVVAEPLAPPILLRGPGGFDERSCPLLL